MRRETSVGKPATRRSPIMAAALAVALICGGWLCREPILRGVGEALIVNDPVRAADFAIMTTEDPLAGELELADLFRQQTVGRVGFLVPTQTDVERELIRRGGKLEGTRSRLMQLGVPADAIVEIDAGEGGTTEGTQALAKWCVEHGIRRVIVITSRDHSRRIRRTLRRQFPREHPDILMHASPFNPFRSTDWWQHRGTVRTGIVEFEKLLLDYAQHPLN